jgi:hypothetical protein
VTALIERTDILDRPIGEGDAGLVIDSLGNIKFFTIGAVDPLNLTEAQQRQAAMLAAFAVVAKSEDMLDTLIGIANTIEAAGGEIVDMGTTN